MGCEIDEEEQNEEKFCVLEEKMRVERAFRLPIENEATERDEERKSKSDLAPKCAFELVPRPPGVSLCPLD